MKGIHATVIFVGLIASIVSVGCGGLVIDDGFFDKLTQHTPDLPNLLPLQVVEQNRPAKAANLTFSVIPGTPENDLQQAFLNLCSFDSEIIDCQIPQQVSGIALDHPPPHLPGQGEGLVSPRPNP